MARPSCRYHVSHAHDHHQDRDFKSAAAAKKYAKSLPGAAVFLECRPKKRAGTLKVTRVLRCRKGSCKTERTPWSAEHAPKRRKRR